MRRRRRKDKQRKIRREGEEVGARRRKGRDEEEMGAERKRESKKGEDSADWGRPGKRSAASSALLLEKGNSGLDRAPFLSLFTKMSGVSSPGLFMGSCGAGAVGLWRRQRANAAES
ncbi:unnamed protein product [Pleuronectes platessa]|uniref:Uncharacterized protein n=1 Tax=Pleuronectes platessa TaxID=8262 RepID=A0A9N7UCK0_PLEPL|nr:unnamed protein product [Pleuronectes platessa]